MRVTYVLATPHGDSASIHATISLSAEPSAKAFLIASVQASSPELNDPETLLRLAKASLAEGVEVLRLEGVENIRYVKAETGALVIGLIKKQYPGFEVFITPTRREVEQLLETGCEIIALDGTNRPRPDGASLRELIEIIGSAGKIAMADCDTVESAVNAFEVGADLVGTTLAGYTEARPMTVGPDLDVVRDTVRALNEAGMRAQKPAADSDRPDVRFALDRLMSRAEPPRHVSYSRGCPVIAEGRFEHRWQVEAALRAGAAAVTVGGAINDPVKNTRKLLPRKPLEAVAAIDIGGTWIRAMVVTAHRFQGPGELLGAGAERSALPATRAERIEWIADFLRRNKAPRMGVCSAGVLWRNKVTLSKKFIPENQGTDYNVLRQYLTGEDEYGVIALGDGHASAWAHACHPDFAGKDLVVLAIGTGLGFGHVREGKIVMGAEGLYSRLNDLPSPGGKTFEQLLGGFALTPKPTKKQKGEANEAIHHAIRMISTFLFPDVIIVCGTVGMQPWLDLNLPPLEGWPTVPVVRSPFGADAGLYGAAAIALFPPFDPER